MRLVTSLAVFALLLTQPTIAQDTTGHDVTDGVVLVRDVTYAPATDTSPARTMHVTFPARAGDAALPVVLYFHGGGWARGSKDDGLDFVRAVAQYGAVGVSVGYRLSDVARYPGAIEDAILAAEYVRDHADELNIDPHRIAAAGHSAGGHLAAVLATSTAGTSRGFGDADEAPLLRCTIAISCPADLRGEFSPQAEEIIAGWLVPRTDPERDRIAAEASPIHYVDYGDPPHLLIHGTDDPLVPIAQAEAYAKALGAAGVEVSVLRIEGGGHGLSGAQVMQAIGDFLVEQLGE